MVGVRRRSRVASPCRLETVVIMPRLARMVGLVPVGFLIGTAALAATAVAGGFSARGEHPHSGYGVAPVEIAPAAPAAGSR
jgi:hypothetical protein